MKFAELKFSIGFCIKKISYSSSAFKMLFPLLSPNPIIYFGSFSLIQLTPFYFPLSKPNSWGKEQK